MHSSYPITQHELATFDIDGVVCLRGVFAPEEMRRLAGAIDEVTSGIGRSQTGYDVSSVADAIWSADRPVNQPGATQYDLDALAALVRSSQDRPLLDEAITVPMPGRFYLDTSTWTRNETIREIALDSRLPELAAALLMSDRVNYYDDQVFVKQPRTAQRTAFHQDYTYFNLEGSKGCVFWIPVDPVTKDSGAMSYVAGSHLWNKLFKPNVFMARTPFPGAEGELLPDIEADISAYDLVQFEVEPGDIIVHHFRTVHGAGGNLRADRPRRALSLRYCGDDMRYHERPGTAPQPHHYHELSEGDPLDCAQFPLVWPRPFPGFALAPYYDAAFTPSEAVPQSGASRAQE